MLQLEEKLEEQAEAHLRAVVQLRTMLGESVRARCQEQREHREACDQLRRDAEEGKVRAHTLTAAIIALTHSFCELPLSFRKST